MKYGLVVFDFDGTLANSFPWMLGIADQMIEKYHLRKVDHSDIEKFRGMDSRQLAHMYGVRWWQLPRMAREAHALMSRDSGTIKLFPGVTELLKTLADLGQELALVSANSIQNVRQILGPQNMALFSQVECGVAVFGKQVRFKKVLRRSGLQPSQMLCIGDEIRDIEAAQKVGLACAAVAWGYTRLDALQARHPDLVFNQISDILPALM